MSDGYAILSLDQVETASHRGSNLIPVRHTLGFRPAGVNAWIADAGGQLIPPHEEDSGNEELYVVVSGSGRVKLEEVARKANVSTATVSRAFNEPDKVSEEVRQRVKDAARALNWIPNAAGRALASRRTHIAGAIIPTLDNEIFAHQISGMQSVFSERGFTLFLGCSNYDPDEGLKQADAMLARGVEALAVVGESHPPELFDALNSRGIPSHDGSPAVAGPPPLCRDLSARHQQRPREGEASRHP